MYDFNGLDEAEEKADGLEKAGKTKTYKLKHTEQMINIEKRGLGELVR